MDIELTDTHTHLYADEFDPDRDEVIKKSMNEGITRFFLPNCDKSTINKMLVLSEKYPSNCFPMMGLHPCSVNENYQEELNLVEEWLYKQQFCAIGEIGIDLYWSTTYKKEQEIAFKKQIEWSIDLKLPIVIHSRNSFDEIYQLLSSCSKNSVKGIFHCFSGTAEQAQMIIDLGFYLGIGGVVTYKNSGLDKIVELIDLKHIVLETDAPYLAPAPFRGKRNESTYIRIIAQKIADIKQTSVDTVAKITTANSKAIFGI